jgi:hypothetical protein
MKAIWLKIRGIIGDIFGIGGPTGVNLKNDAGVLQVRNAADDAYAAAKVAHIETGADLNTVVDLLSLQGRIPNVSFSFPGDTPPAAGSNSGAFGICHTDGGTYNAGRVVYDNGTALLLMPTEVVRTITTSASVNGDLNLLANGLYALQGGNWVSKGGSPSVTGYTRNVISRVIGTAASYDTTTTVPEDAVVLNTIIDVTTAYSASATITVSLAGTTPLELFELTTETQYSGQYENPRVYTVAAANEGVVHVAIGGTPGVGVGVVYVEYASPAI